jgi:hypothetical protein
LGEPIVERSVGKAGVADFGHTRVSLGCARITAELPPTGPFSGLAFFGVRQCFALPLWFFWFLLMCLCSAKKTETKHKKQKRQSKALPHSKRAEVELKGCNFLIVILAILLYAPGVRDVLAQNCSEGSGTCPR